MLIAGLVPGGKPRYGHYHGPIAEYTMFSGRPIIRHGWIEKPDKTIVDPTRWVFEGVDPYIFEGPDKEGCYDAGGNKLRAALMYSAPPPEYNPEERQFDVPFTEAGVIMKVLLGGYEGDKFSMRQLHYIANLPPDFEEEDIVVDIYRWLRDQGLKCLIPIDNWRLIME